jgi:hypothetical protein
VRATEPEAARIRKGLPAPGRHQQSNNPHPIPLQNQSWRAPMRVSTMVPQAQSGHTPAPARRVTPGTAPASPATSISGPRSTTQVRQDRPVPAAIVHPSVPWPVARYKLG